MLAVQMDSSVAHQTSFDLEFIAMVSNVSNFLMGGAHTPHSGDI
jgi:hypothetical protein